MTIERDLCLISLAGIFIPFAGPIIAGVTTGICYAVVDMKNAEEKLEETKQYLQNFEHELHSIKNEKNIFTEEHRGSKYLIAKTSDIDAVEETFTEEDFHEAQSMSGTHDNIA